VIYPEADGMISTDRRAAATCQCDAARARSGVPEELPMEGTHLGVRRRWPRSGLFVGKRLVIELDGGHHNDDETERDERQAWLSRRIPGSVSGIPM
jgi:hypothetical protein